MRKIKIVDNAKYCRLHNVVFSKNCKQCDELTNVEIRIVNEKLDLIDMMCAMKEKINYDFRYLVVSKLDNIDEKYLGKEYRENKKDSKTRDIFNEKVINLFNTYSPVWSKNIIGEIM